VGVKSGDVVYAELVIKPDTATVATPANWALVAASPGLGGGTQGAGTGAVKVHLYRRVAASALSGTQAFTITAGSSPVATMRAFRAPGTATNVVYETETTTSYSRTTGSTTFGGTGAVNVTAAARDALVYISASSDDQSTTHTITAVTAAGATLSAATQSPADTVINAQGNDISAAAAYVIVTSGTSTAAPVATNVGASAETGGGFFYRVSATGTLNTPAGTDAYSTAVLAYAPELYLRLSDGTTTAADSSGNGRNGTYSGSYTQGVSSGSSGLTDTAAAFTSAGFGRVDVPHDPALSLNAGAGRFWTLTFRLNAAARVLSFPGVVRKAIGGAGLVNEGFGVYHSASNSSIKLGGFEAHGPSPALGVWNHWVLTYDGANFRWYSDGTLQTTVAFATLNNSADTNPLILNLMDDYGDQTIDELAVIQNTALTAQQVADLYTASITAASVITRFRRVGKRR
jgi:hypothetical protein